MFVTKRNGEKEPVYFDKITSRISKLVKPGESKYIDPVLVAQKVVGSIFPGITTEELDNESAKICVNLCTSHHLYSMLAGRIVVSNLQKKTIDTFVEKEELIQEKLGFLESNWLSWIKENRDELNQMIDYDRDYIFDYFGFKTLERAYLIKIGSEVIERPQDMLMRVASFINQGDLSLVKKTYDMISHGYYTHASPTLFNAGNQRSQLASCFLAGTDDSIEGITKTWADVAKISKWGGGIGLHVSNIRAKDTLIKGTNGPSSGIIPMLKVYNEIARYIDQCFVGSTKVYTQRGLIPIEQIKPNDKVCTEDGSLQEVEKVYCDKYENKILNFKIFHDYENIKVTPSHPFYVVKNQPTGTNFSTILNRLDKKLIVPEWVDAKDITENDLIGFPIPKFIADNQNLDEFDCYMYGLMLGDGHILKDRSEGGITLGFKKDDVAFFVREYLKRNGIHFWETLTESTVQIRWTTSSKFKFVRSQLYDINSEKHIDESMLHLPEDKSKWIIKGVLDTDGCIGKEITLEMTSQNVIDGIKYLILRMGILCSGYSRDRIGNVSPYKNIKTTKLSWVLRIPKAPKIAKLLDIECGQFFKFIAHNDILYTRLKEVSEEDIKASVYDLEVKNNHNYLTQAGLVHNGGKRKGSIAIYLEPHHPDILAFLDLKKNFGAETERARDLFLAMWISDLFMKQVEKDGDWYLMCPDKCPGLTDAYGEDYEKLYWSYVEAKKYNTIVKAREVMKAMLDSQLETGTPYIGFKDNINKKSNQKNIGTIKSSNLCIEIVEYSDASEYAVCNLASIAINKCVISYVNNNLWTIYTKENCKYCQWTKSYLMNNDYFFHEEYVDYDKLKEITRLETPTYPQIYYGDQYVGGYSEFFQFTKASFDYEKLYDIAYLATINLNKIIDINYYPVIEAKKSNIRHRPIAVGIQGLADTLVQLKINFDSEESIDFNTKMMETIYLACLTASSDISKERQITFGLLPDSIDYPEYYDSNYKLLDLDLDIIYHKLKPNACELGNNKFLGAYSTFEGSPISQGQFQFDLWSLDRNKLYYKEKWIQLEEHIKKYGVRNSLVTALMPTASTSQILGNNECFEFFTNNIYTRRTLAGDFPLVNKYLIDDLTNIGLWSTEMKQLILANNGSIANFNNIPEQIRNLYKTIWEIKQIWVLKNAVARGPFVDQTQSMNIFMPVPDYQKLYSSHFWAWSHGLKTGIYYLRSKAAKDATKFTVDPTIQKKLESITHDEVCENCSA